MEERKEMTIKRNIKQWFIAGLVVLVPFFITVYVVVFAFNLLDGWTKRLPYHFPGAGLVVLLAVTVLVGAAVRLYAGNRLHRLAEFLIINVPVVSLIYTTAKEVCHTIFNRDKNAFQYVVVIEYGGQNTLGFVTGEAPLTVNEAMGVTGKVLNVYVMQAFSPAAGFVFLVPEEDAIRVNIKVEDALKFVLTGGMVKGPINDAEQQAAATLLVQQSQEMGMYPSGGVSMPQPIDCPHCGSKPAAPHDPRCVTVTGVYSVELASERANSIFHKHLSGETHG